MKNSVRIFIAGLLILFFILNSKNIKIEESPEKWIPENSEEIIYYKNFLKNFTGDAVLIITIENRDVNREGIAQELRKIEGIKVYKYPLPFLISKTENKDLTIFIVTYKPESELNPAKPEIINKIKNLLKTKGLKYHIAGTGVIFTFLKEEVKKETFIIFSFAFLILIILLIFILQDFKSLIYTLIVATGGLLSMCFIALKFNIGLSSLSLVLIPIILFYSSTLCFHIIYKEGKFKEIIKPSFFATLTTIFGFGSFLLSNIPLLKDFSKLAVSGILGSFIFSIILFYPEAEIKGIKGFFLKLNISRISLKRKIIPILFISFALFFLFFLKNLKIETNTLKILPPNSKPVIDHEFIEKKAGYYTPVEYVFPVKTPMNKIKKFVEETYKLKEVGGYIAPFNFYRFFLNPQKAGYISKDGKFIRITFFIKLLPTLQGIKLIEKINRIAESLNLKDYRVTGYVTIYARIAHSLSKTFFKSLFIAFNFIFIIFLIYFRNIKIFLSSLISNAYPILMLLSFMAVLKIPLDIFTIPIASLLLGIVVDDTFYILYFFKKEKIVEKAYLKAELPGFLTSFMLFISFLTLLFSSLPPVKNFGILCSLSILFAYIGDFIILPFVLNKLF